MTTRALVSDDVLPDWHELWAAVRGVRGPGTHPVTTLASGLARTHRLANGRVGFLLVARADGAIDTRRVGAGGMPMPHPIHLSRDRFS